MCQPSGPWRNPSRWALIFGRGLLGVTVIVSLVTFFPTLVNVAVALRAAPTLACDVVLSMGGSW